jgi:hypothetical protein
MRMPLTSLLIEVLKFESSKVFGSTRMRECANETPRQGEADPRREEKCSNAGMRECFVLPALFVLSALSGAMEGEVFFDRLTG